MAEEACKQRLTNARKRVTDLETRISSAEEKERELQRQQSHNSLIDQKRRTAGFWRKIGSYLADQVYDLEPLRREIQRLDSREAQEEIPYPARSGKTRSRTGFAGGP